MDATPAFGGRPLPVANRLPKAGAPRRIVEDLAERIWRAALPTLSAVQGVRLREAVESGERGPTLWPVVVVASLDGRMNAFRRRGAFAGRILSALVVSSEQVVLDLAQTSADPNEAPFIWTPASRR